MLGQPIATIAQPLGVAGQIKAVAQRLAHVGAFDDGTKIEDG